MIVVVVHHLVRHYVCNRTVRDSGKPGKRLMLIGHIDTVDIARGWLTDPFTPTEDAEEDGKIHGLGAMDMKGGLAGILQTLEYYAEHKDEFTGSIIACFVADEEGLSKGTYQLVELRIEYDPSVCDSNILAVSLGIPTVTFGPSVVECTLLTNMATHGR